MDADTPKNVPLFREALSLSSGTISYLIGCTRYDVIDKVQCDFALWCLDRLEYLHWQRAWKEWSATHDR